MPALCIFSMLLWIATNNLLMKNLLTLRTDTLLDKFGSGGHAPGSGSAAALMGILAAKLVVTVGQLTLARSEYRDHHARVEASCNEIILKLVPALEALFQEDAEVFDKVISARQARDKATDAREKRKLAELALEELRTATAIPFQIAETCLELIDHAATVFDAGFKAARGDTGAAISSAVAGVLASVFVINLNLKSFKGSYWARRQRKACDYLQKIVTDKHQAALQRVMQLRADDLASLSASPADPFAHVAKLAEESKVRYTRDDIDIRASAIQELVWRMRKEIWLDTAVPSNPIELLNPNVALVLLGYTYQEAETLGTFASKAGSYEVAGLLEAQIGKVTISAQMRPTVRHFTAAHELGHVVLHPHLKVAHRDRPLDGSTTARELIEQEADKFASSYLMPSRLLKTRFTAIFGREAFFLSDETAFALFGVGLAEARLKNRSVRDLSRALARAKLYDGQHIVPLADQFIVSVEAMAIRLEELKLLVIV